MAKNKKVIRNKKNKVKGNFTTVPYSILNNKNLTGNGLKLLIGILSDNDILFEFQESVYVDRYFKSKDTYYIAIKNLVECGYLRKTKPFKGSETNFYLISEYGNLNQKEISEVELNEFIKTLTDVIVKNKKEFMEIMVMKISNIDKKIRIQELK